MADCVECNASLRDGAAFCGRCGACQPAPVETPEAIARYRDVFARFTADGALEDAERAQLEALRGRLGVSLATHAALCNEHLPDIPAPVVVRLEIDVATLGHLAVGARGLIRLRIGNEGALGLDCTVTPTLSGAALPVVKSATILPGRAAVLVIPTTPSIAGFYELAGELRVVDLIGESSGYRFSDIHLRVAGVGPQVQVVNIDQSSARVVDNSRSTFGGATSGGVLGPDDGEWRPIGLVMVREARALPAAPLARVDFAVTTETATYRVATTLAQGDIATVYGGHISGSHPPVEVAVKIADGAGDNDLLQHEARVLEQLTAETDKPVIHFAPPRDRFRTADGRLGTVFDKLDGYDLTTVRDRCRQRGLPGLPARHLVWLMRRSLAALGWAHKHGILHGNLDPSHILIRPHDHMVWVVDWCWAVVEPARTGQGFKALNEVYSPPEVRERGRPTPASDLYSLGKVMIHVAGGDPGTKAVPDIEPRLARLMRFFTVESQGGRAQDAWEQYVAVDRIRKQIWGEHQFVPLEL